MDKVLFDTNAYRYLVKGKSSSQIGELIRKLKRKEKYNDIQTLISPIVAKELLAHITDKNDPSFEICLSAIKALYLHSSDEDAYNMIASPELLISKAFFGATIPEKEETNAAIGQMIFHIATNPTDKIFKKFRGKLQINRSHVLESERNYANAMKAFVKNTDPNAKGWQIFVDDEKKRKKVLTYIRSENCSLEIAKAFLFITYQLLAFPKEKTNINENEMMLKAKALMSIFPEPIGLQKQIFENLVNSQFNLFEHNRTNFVWDIQLMFNVGNHHVEGSKLYFVTDDKAMFRSAIKENAKYTILNYNDYMDYIK